MNKWYIIFLLLLGVVMVVGSIMLRVAFSGKYEIKTIDLVFIVIPLLLVGLASGKLQELDLFGVKADFSQLWTNAAETQVENQVSAAPISTLDDVVEMINMAEKGLVGEIPRLIEERTEALSFRLGMGGYDERAIKTYFNSLLSSSYLRFVVVNNADGTLFGIYAAADLVGSLRALGDSDYRQFAEMLNDADDRWFARLPGFVPASAAITIETTKREALKDMETLDRPSLPVIDASNRFIGTVDRAKLTASLILEVTEQIASE